jgi:asparagine N-glycosylation enzyme membrane subunit Stt3
VNELPVKPTDFLYMAPLTVLTVVALLLVVIEAFTRGKHRAFLMPLCVVGCLFGALAAIVVARALDSVRSRCSAACSSPTSRRCS